MKANAIFVFVAAVSGGSGGGRDPLGPKSFIFMQFSAKNLQNNRLAHPLFWEILDPPLQCEDEIGFSMNASGSNVALAPI